MPNPHILAINPETELGEAIFHVIELTKYGQATFIVKEFLEKHKDEMITFWNEQDKDGVAVWNKFHEKWSMSKDAQNAVKHEKKIKPYLTFGYNREMAEQFVTNFPDEKPMDVIKQFNATQNSKGYAFQMELAKARSEGKEVTENLPVDEGYNEQQKVEAWKKFESDEKAKWVGSEAYDKWNLLPDGPEKTKIHSDLLNEIKQRWEQSKPEEKKVI